MIKKENLKEGDKIIYFEEDENSVISIKRRNGDGSFDEEVLKFFTSNTGVVRKIYGKSVKIYDKFDRKTVIVPVDKIFCTCSAKDYIENEDKYIGELLDEADGLNREVLNHLNQKIREEFGMHDIK